MEADKKTINQKSEYLEHLKTEFLRISDELYANSFSPMNILSLHVRSKLERDKSSGRMTRASSSQ